MIYQYKKLEKVKIKFMVLKHFLIYFSVKWNISVPFFTSNLQSFISIVSIRVSYFMNFIFINIGHRLI